MQSCIKSRHYLKNRKTNNKINDAKEIENNNYSIESWSRFEKSLLEAIIVNEDSNATQEQVDKAYDDLDKAIKGLSDAPVIVDKKGLSNVIETTNDFVEKRLYGRFMESI